MITPTISLRTLKAWLLTSDIHNLDTWCPVLDVPFIFDKCGQWISWTKSFEVIYRDYWINQQKMLNFNESPLVLISELTWKMKAKWFKAKYQACKTNYRINFHNKIDKNRFYAYAFDRTTLHTQFQSLKPIFYSFPYLDQNKLHFDTFPKQWPAFILISHQTNTHLWINK